MATISPIPDQESDVELGLSMTFPMPAGISGLLSESVYRLWSGEQLQYCLGPELTPGEQREALAVTAQVDVPDEVQGEVRAKQTSEHGPIVHLSDGRIVSVRRVDLGDRGVFVVATDVSEVYALQRELESTILHANIVAAEHRALQAAMPDAYVLTTAEGTVVAFNRSAERLFGMPAGDVLGKPGAVLFANADDWKQVYLSSNRAANEAAKHELDGRRRDGSLFPMALAATKVVAQSGVYRSMLIRDLTSARHEKLELQAALDRAESARRAKSEFLANMSHEIRTPMNGILGMLNFLIESDLSGEQREHAEIARDSAALLLTIINDILDFSKIEAGKLVVDPTPFALDSMATDCVSLLQAQAAKKHVRVKLTTRGLRRGYIGDQGRLRQVVLNLLSNAVKFTERGTVELRVTDASAATTDAAMPSLCQLRIEVADQGIGIPADRLEHIFGKFTQAESSTTRRFGGTGLGLAISKQIIELMGGRIGVTSSVGKGSTFWFEVALPEAARLPSLPPIEDPALPPSASILLVEDNVVNQKVAVKLLEKLGSRVKIAQNGVEAIRLVREHAYDLVFMDCQMPEMDGYEATRQIRADERFLHLPIVAMTANAMSGDRERCLEAGMTDFLTKPIASHQVAQMIRKWVVTGKPREPSE